MQSNVKETDFANIPKEIFVKDGERPTVRSLFESLEAGQLLHITYERKLHNAIKQECLRQNDIARAVGGELDINFRTKKKGDEILIYRLK